MTYDQLQHLQHEAARSFLFSEGLLITFCLLAWLSIITNKYKAQRPGRGAIVGIIFAIAYLLQSMMFPNSGTILNTTQQFVTDQYAAVGLGFSLYGWRRATEGKSGVVQLSILFTSIIVVKCIALRLI